MHGAWDASNWQLGHARREPFVRRDTANRGTRKGETSTSLLFVKRFFLPQETNWNCDDLLADGEAARAFCDVTPGRLRGRP